MVMKYSIPGIDKEFASVIDDCELKQMVDVHFHFNAKLIHIYLQHSVNDRLCIPPWPDHSTVGSCKHVT
ncbi:hypothetical protein QJS04_geneDACA000978 [Acorus gramineus]|uniref:Uncharacterized protein n=1 Tax=Acorus gramineus TaxID=55184 RepID=A0AAV9AAS7_ACOGR|nr:hypothetical protein QJS04_geneDACA000978 [Acorus gramineus]